MGRGDGAPFVSLQQVDCFGVGPVFWTVCLKPPGRVN